MEKISIARRRKENQRPLFPIKTDNSSHPQSCPDHTPSYPDHTKSYPEPDVVNTSIPLPFLKSMISEEANAIQTGKKQFTVEIIDGLEKPVKMIVSVQTSGQKGFFNVKEAARILHVSENTLYRQLQQGNLPGLKIGRQWRVLLAPDMTSSK